MLKRLLVLSSLLFSQYSYADQASQKVTTIEVLEINSLGTSVEMPKAPVNPIEDIAIMIDSLIALGKKILPII